MIEVLKVGLKADINIIDWENVSSSDPFMTQDLPAGGKRLMQHMSYVTTIVSGKVTQKWEFTRTTWYCCQISKG